MKASNHSTYATRRSNDSDVGNRASLNLLITLAGIALDSTSKLTARYDGIAYTNNNAIAYVGITAGSNAACIPVFTRNIKRSIDHAVPYITRIGICHKTRSITDSINLNGSSNRYAAKRRPCATSSDWSHVPTASQVNVLNNEVLDCSTIDEPEKTNAI